MLPSKEFNSYISYLNVKDYLHEHQLYIIVKIIENVWLIELSQVNKTYETK